MLDVLRTNLLASAGGALLIVVIVGALVVWLTDQRQKRLARERAQRDRLAQEAAELERLRGLPLPDGGVELPTEDVEPAHDYPGGKVMLVVNGTFAANVVLFLLKLLHESGLGGFVGSILLVELNEGTKKRFLTEVPAEYGTRLVYVESPSLAGGLLGRSWEEVNNAKDFWGEQVRGGALLACETHLRANRGTMPSLVLLFLSLGGSAPLSTVALREITRKFPLARLACFTAYPDRNVNRAQVRAVFDQYRELGLKHFIVADNLGDYDHPDRSPSRNDTGMLAIIAGFASASQRRDANQELDNFFTYAFPPEGGVASYHVYHTEIPGYAFQPHPLLPPRYYVYQDTMTAMTITALREVEKDQFSAVTAALGQSGATRYDIIVTALTPAGLRAVEQRIRASQSMKGPKSADYEMVFGSIRTRVDPERPNCPLYVVMVSALTDPEHHLDSLFVLPQWAAKQQLSDGVMPAAGYHTNGDQPGASAAHEAVIDGVVIATNGVHQPVGDHSEG